jgi:hypothetical protein
MRSTTRMYVTTTTAVLALTGAAAPALADPGGGATVVRDQAFYVDGEAYRTVATPNTLPAKAPRQSFDRLYSFGDIQPSVAEAAPGMRGYNGGRWIVNLVDHATGWEAYADGTDAHGMPVFVSDEAVEKAIDAGALTVTYDVKRFTCPVIPL